MAKKLKGLEKLTGVSFLEHIAAHEEECATITLKQLPKLGEKAPVCYELLGMTLALLDCAACCYWGCAGGDHRLEFLVGRTANSAYAAIDLAVRGYYDQALSLARTLGETANLLSLFCLDANTLADWKRSSEKERKKRFSAVRVRLAIEALAGDLPVDEDRYGRLSRLSIHQSPDALPQAHGPHGQAITFSVYQPAGFLLSLNEIALPVAFIAVFSPSLLKLDKNHRKTFHKIGRELVKAMGGVNIEVEGRPWFKLN
jgi:hypothetical protein